ncbi:22513_t:CDS:2 [Cetraspora pellucida]|uniref:22513_t:CDS:1 n=1 Tax=Cetraspora pellucida TaxID=1433469 RepID=A0A9N9D0E3_9GLOM|nr:22513_t:CDS:2 [Cetraspora pellucida]
MIEITEKDTFDVYQICKEKNIDIRKFTPFHEQTEDNYAELLFEPIGPSQSTNNENPDKLDIEEHRLIEPPIITEDLCDLVKAAIKLNKSPTISTLEPTTTNNLIAALYSSEEPNDKILNETKVDCYLCEPAEKMGSQKYLSVLLTSVLSEQLFLDTELHIMALCNRLHSDIVKQIMFLKHNMQHFSIFKLDEL